MRRPAVGGGLVLAASLAAAVPLMATVQPAASAAASGPARSAALGSPRGRVVWGWGDSAGYHLAFYAAGQSRQIALLRPAGLDVASWTGSQCVSGDLRYAAVVTAPADAANTPAGRATGAFAYSVDLATGQVRPIADGVSLVYYNPGCGTGDIATFTTITPEGTSTTIRTADLATGAVTATTTVAGQYTSAVPMADGASVTAVHDGSLVTVTTAGTRAARVTQTARAAAGDAYDLVPTADGGLDYLTGRGSVASAWHERAGRTALLGTGPLVSTDLQNGAAGKPVAFGLRPATSAGHLGDGLVDAAAGGLAFPVASADGGTVLGAAKSGAPGQVLAQAGGQLRSAVLTASPPAVTTTTALLGTIGPRAAIAAAASAPGTAASSPCAVPRLDPHRQALQPNAAQVDWAIQMAAANKLTGSLARPAGYANLGQPGYAANTDFPAISLTDPSGGGAHTVPPIVFEAIAAQESNFSQASWHALPGIAGDPLIADYYGNGGNSIDSIDYASADCGYGVVQVTTGMHTGDPQYRADKQARIAVDYEENIAAGLNILESTWNQLASLGITANNGSPADLENWYFAAWAYNTGIHPVSSHGTAGLGWANNPANPDYKPNRPPYLKDTYADASHPADWPYQERVMGWMGSPLIQFGAKDYAPAKYQPGSDWLQIPPVGIACSATNFCTPPGGSGTPGCSLSDDECWWTGHATWVTDCATQCAVTPFALPQSKEPPVTDPHPATCNLDTRKVPSTPAGKPIIVDDLSATGPLNVVGCSESPNWRNSGSFTYAPGTNAAGQQVGLIDTHQLGAGFGGHILFTHLESAKATPDLINTGTWKPKLPGLEYYDIRIHVPATGADATAAQYTLTPAPGAVPITLTVNQQVGETWINAGSFAMKKGATLTLTNAGTTGLGTTDIAFDAVAFVPQGGHPVILMKGSCPAIDYVAARGSGQGGPGTPSWHSTAGDPLGMGAQLAQIGQKLTSSRGKGTVTQESIGYLADSIWTAPLKTEGKWSTQYTRDLEQGVALTLDDLRQQFATCGTRQRFVLAGYSQGAMVMHRVVIALQSSGASADQALLKQVAAVVLVADGDRKKGDTVTFTGTAAHSSQGVARQFVAQADPPQVDFSKAIGSRVLSICDKNDFICDFPVGASLATILARAVIGVPIHTGHYKTAADVASYVSWVNKRLS
jgi:hypothetical protein